MSLLLSEMINWIKTYYGDAIFLTMAVFSYIYIFVCFKKVRSLIIYPSAFILFLLLNPLLYKYIFKGGRYWRFFWMFPSIIMISVAITMLIKSSKTVYEKLIVSIVFVLLIVIKGTNVYQNGGFEKTDNLFKVNPETQAVCSVILEYDESPRCILPNPIFCEARQYSGDIELMYGRDVQGYIMRAPDDIKKVYACMESEMPDYEYVLSKAFEGRYEFVVTKELKPVDDITLDKYGYNLIQNVDGYNIYYNSF